MFNLPRMLSLGVALALVSGAICAEQMAPVYDVDSLSHEGMVTRSSVLPGEQALNRLEHEIGASPQTEVNSRVNSMQTELQAMRNQVEQLHHQLQLLQTQQRLMYQDVDKRLSVSAAATQEEPAAKAPKPAGKTKAKTNNNNNNKTTGTHAKLGGQPVAPITAPNLAQEQQAYQTAYSLIKAKKYTDAIETLQKMLLKYPSGPFAANAHYWLGELYNLSGENAQAAAEFGSVVRNYAGSPRVADAQLKVGLIYATQARWADARSSFKKVVRQYPGSASARLAMEELKQLKIAGH